MMDELQRAHDPDDPLAGLRAIASLRRVTEALEQTQVEAALRAGLTWSDIGDALGVTRQAVHKKYKDRVPKGLAPTRTRKDPQ